MSGKNGAPQRPGPRFVETYDWWFAPDGVMVTMRVTDLHADGSLSNLEALREHRDRLLQKVGLRVNNAGRIEPMPTVQPPPPTPPGSFRIRS